MSKYIAFGIWLLFGFIVLIGMTAEGQKEVEDLAKWYKEIKDNE